MPQRTLMSRSLPSRTFTNRLVYPASSASGGLGGTPSSLGAAKRSDGKSPKGKKKDKDGKKVDDDSDEEDGETDVFAALSQGRQADG